MIRVGRITTVLCVVVYAFTAISGYLLFGKNTESDVLTNFDMDLGIPFSSTLNYIIRIGYILHLILVFPVIHFSLRQTVDEVVFKGTPPLSENRKRFVGLTVVLLALIFIASTMIPSIWTAFKFTGATTAVSLGFIFPSLVALRLSGQGEELRPQEKLLSWTMLVLAIIVSIIGVTGCFNSPTELRVNWQSFAQAHYSWFTKSYSAEASSRLQGQRHHFTSFASSTKKGIISQREMFQNLDKNIIGTMARSFRSWVKERSCFSARMETSKSSIRYTIFPSNALTS
ncbi:Amino acid transporter AVT6E-like protein [Drosera capensis]